jgi:hypothetical protein
VPLILRSIRKARWYNEDLPWLAPDEPQADVLADLNTSQNTLSVWLIEDDRSNLERVITALAANRNRPSNFDYAIIDRQFLDGIGVKFDHEPGQTPDRDVNRWHLDMIELSASGLLMFARTLYAHAQKERILEKRIRHLITEAVNSGHLDRSELRATMLGKLQLS